MRLKDSLCVDSMDQAGAPPPPTIRCSEAIRKLKTDGMDTAAACEALRHAVCKRGLVAWARRTTGQISSPPGPESDLIRLQGHELFWDLQKAPADADGDVVWEAGGDFISGSWITGSFSLGYAVDADDSDWQDWGGLRHTVTAYCDIRFEVSEFNAAPVRRGGSALVADASRRRPGRSHKTDLQIAKKLTELRAKISCKDTVCSMLPDQPGFEGVKVTYARKIFTAFEVAKPGRPPHPKHSD